ncbi:MAG: serine--tRNA ligase [Candidatus Wildermuthbacteria bacterium GWA2_46_15]|uniref:Serine--tRNA ligase n=1 Tax=Candidatus Wildermuthbacteria bacterium GWA2_46_15 TaxID=1802443 RepID=A0A1G2QMX5_9BACT|nr:MAG: serine--tRNA ligase [Candidatus Wildermuthbacteria bacterium GWA2_46_15]
MLDIKLIRQNPELVKEGCRKKQVKVDIDRLLEIDKKRRELMLALEDIRAQKNKANDEIKQIHDKSEREVVILKMRELDKGNDRLEAEFKEIDAEFQGLLRSIPNLPLESVPEGKDDTENKVIREVGKRTKFDFAHKDYLELGQNLDLIDTERAGKTSGSRFGFLKNEAALLEFAIISLAMETAGKRGFIPIVPPVLLKPEMMEGMGYIERGGEEIYFLEKDNLYLVGTSEQIIGSMHADEIFEEKDLPQRYIGFSSCFRREAGSYGKDTRGILRVHQFDKAEMFSFCPPEKSVGEHQLLLSIEEELMQKLELPYHVLQICGGDLGDPAAAKYDLEVWLPSQEKYRETHSTSNCTDYQARRLNIRYRKKDGSLEFVHTLNGTAFAVGRTLIAILENYQQKDGSIKTPKALQKYVDFKEIKR